MSFIRREGGRRGVKRAATTIGLLSLIAGAAWASPVSAGATDVNAATATPIKHVIVIIGENHTFDNVFAHVPATRRPARAEPAVRGNRHRHGQRPGPTRSKARQQQATDTANYQLDPKDDRAVRDAPAAEHDLRRRRRATGQDGRPRRTRASQRTSTTRRIRSPSTCPTSTDHGEYTKYGTCEFNGAFVGDPIHRFYQMYQEVSRAARADLWTWVHETAGDSNGAPPPTRSPTSPPTRALSTWATTTWQQGDAPVLRLPRPALRDVRQLPPGGDGRHRRQPHRARHRRCRLLPERRAAGDRHRPRARSRTPTRSRGPTTSTPRTGTGSRAPPTAAATRTAPITPHPGVAGVFEYLAACPTRRSTAGDCAKGHYYLLNNYNPGYNVDGTLNTSTFTVPPQHSLTSIGNELSAHGITLGLLRRGLQQRQPRTRTTAASVTRCSTRARS